MLKSFSLLVFITIITSSCASLPGILGQETKAQYDERLKLYEKIREKDLDSVKIIVQRGIVNLDPPTQPYQVNKALAYASIYGNLAIVKYIYSQGVDIDGVIAYGGTPLLRAAEVENNDIVKYLIQNGADVNHPNGFGVSPMIGFSVICNTDLIDMALEHGGDIEKAYKITVSSGYGRRGLNPIQSAVHHGNLACVEHLISLGAKLDVQTDDGRSLKDLGAEKPEILKVLDSGL